MSITTDSRMSLTTLSGYSCVEEAKTRYVPRKTTGPVAAADIKERRKARLETGCIGSPDPIAKINDASVPNLCITDAAVDRKGRTP